MAISDKEIIYEAIKRIETYTENLTFEEFKERQMVIDAVMRNISVIRTIQRGSSLIGFFDNEIEHYELWEFGKKEFPNIKNKLKQ